MLIVAWFAAAWADERDPLPATWVERPLVVPRGWCTATAAVERAQRRGEGTLGLRYGVAPRLELRAGAGVRAASGGIGPADPEIGARWSVVRREPPNRSVALDLSWRAPLSERPVDDGAARVALLGARQVGPVLATGWVGAVWRPGPARDGAVGGAQGLVQLGPLAAVVGAEAEWAGLRRVVAFAGGGVQLTRGVGAVATARAPVVGGSAGTAARIALEIVW